MSSAYMGMHASSYKWHLGVGSSDGCTEGLEDREQTLDAQVEAFFGSAPPLQNRHEITQKLNHSPSGK